MTSEGIPSDQLLPEPIPNSSKFQTSQKNNGIFVLNTLEENVTSSISSTTNQGPLEGAQCNFVSINCPSNHVPTRLPHSPIQTLQSSVALLSPATSPLNASTSKSLVSASSQEILNLSYVRTTPSLSTPKFSNSSENTIEGTAEKKLIQESHSIHDSPQKNSTTDDVDAPAVSKKKNSKFIHYTEEDYEKGLETLNLAMRMFLDTLEKNPKVLFVELNRIGENTSSNECVYKTRNKSVVQFLTPSEVKQTAMHDLELMCNTIKKMVMASGKLITSGIQPVQTVKVKTAPFNCKTCKMPFLTRSDMVNHIEINHPNVPLQNCTFCNKKFLMLRGLRQHTKMIHEKVWSGNRGKEHCEMDDSKRKNQSYYSTENKSAVCLPNTPPRKNCRNKDDFLYSNLNVSVEDFLEIVLDDEKDHDGSSRSQNSDNTHEFSATAFHEEGFPEVVLDDEKDKDGFSRSQNSNISHELSTTAFHEEGFPEVVVDDKNKDKDGSSCSQNSNNSHEFSVTAFQEEGFPEVVLDNEKDKDGSSRSQNSNNSHEFSATAFHEEDFPEVVLGDKNKDKDGSLRSQNSSNSHEFSATSFHEEGFPEVVLDDKNKDKDGSSRSQNSNNSHEFSAIAFHEEGFPEVVLDNEKDKDGSSQSQNSNNSHEFSATAFHKEGFPEVVLDDKNKDKDESLRSQNSNNSHEFSATAFHEVGFPEVVLDDKNKDKDGSSRSQNSNNSHEFSAIAFHEECFPGIVLNDEKDKDGSSRSQNSNNSHEFSATAFHEEVSVSSHSLTNSVNSNDSFQKVKNISLDCSALDSERKSEFEISDKSSMQVKNEFKIKETTEKSSKFQVTAILPMGQHNVEDVFKQETNDLNKTEKNLDFICLSKNNLEPEKLCNSLMESSTLNQDIPPVEKTSTEKKAPDFDTNNSENKSVPSKYVNDKAGITVDNYNVLLSSDLIRNETTEAKNLLSNNAFSDLNMTESASLKTVSLSKSEKQEKMPSSRQNDKKTDKKTIITKDEIFPKTVCCTCLNIINIMMQLDKEQQCSKVKCHECPFCGISYTGTYFEHHVATVHLTCNQQGCSSRYIQTGWKLRELLTAQIKIDCLHVNCNHNSLIDLEKPIAHLDIAKFEESQTIQVFNDLQDVSVLLLNNNEEKRQECDTTENNTEIYQSKYYPKNLKTYSKNSKKLQRKKEQVEVSPNKCNVSDIKFSPKTEPYNSVKELEHCFEENQQIGFTNSFPVDMQKSNAEENKVSSSNGYLYEVKSKNSCFDESSEGIKAVSIEPSLCCCVCKEIFHHEQKLLGHLFNCHRFTHPFTCDVCFLCYKDLKDLQVHVQVHGKQIILENIKPLSSTVEEELSSVNFGKEEKLFPVKSSTAEKFSLAKSNLMEQMSAVQFPTKKELFLVNSVGTQELSSLEPSVMKELPTMKLSVPKACCSIQNSVPNELPALKVKCAKEKSAESHLKERSIKCYSAEKQFNFVGDTVQNEQKNSPSKKKRLKIPCIVEKVEYPLDIHNLYAHIRKVDDPKVVNSLELGLQSNSPNDSINVNLPTVEMKKKSPVDFTTVEKGSRKRKILKSFSRSPKRIKMNDCETQKDSNTGKTTFQCKTCKKTFDFKRSYSEHMFFMHDAIFDDSVVSDLLKPSSKKRMKLRSTLEKTGCRNNSSTISEFSQSTETSVSIEDSEKEKSNLVHPESTEKPENDLTEEVVSEARTCSQCGERYVDITSYFQHRYDIHGDDSLVHVCENCGKVLITVNMVNLHLCTQVNTFSCKDCGINFINASVLKEHNTAMHFESIGPHVCHYCKKCFLTNRMLEKHRRIIHSNTHGTDSVKKEGKMRFYEKNRSRASVTHHVEKVRSSFSNRVLRKKNQAVSLEKPSSIKKGKVNSLTCPVCKFVLQTTRRLQAHLMVNHSKVTDICLLCNKLFAFGRGLRHMLDFHIVPTCSQNKEYKLSWEGDSRMDVKEAIEVLGEKRLLAICCYDDYRTLTDSASFQCRVCLITYSAIRYYRSHYIQRHDELCALCDQNFESNKDFLLHVEGVHNSVKHYLWFTETIISTIIQTERSKDNPSESLVQIIRRKLDENEVNVASQLLERLEDERVPENSKYLETSQINDTACKLPGASSELPESAIVLHLPESGLPAESCEVSVVTSELSIATNEPPTVSYSADILELPDFCMEYEITDNETIITQNPNYFGNEILVGDINNETECTSRVSESKRANNSTVSVTGFDGSNCTFENSININDSSVNSLKENETMSIIGSCDVENRVSSGNIAKDIEFETREGYNSLIVADAISQKIEDNSLQSNQNQNGGIDSTIDNEKVALVVTEEELRLYKNNVQALAERLSINCNELSVDEIVETLEAYVSSQGV